MYQMIGQGGGEHVADTPRGPHIRTDFKFESINGFQGHIWDRFLGITKETEGDVLRQKKTR